MPQHERRHKFILRLLAVGFLAGAALTTIPAQAASGLGPLFPEPAWARKLAPADRFLILTNWNNEAVLDKETGLVWERTPVQNGSWTAARNLCATLTTGGRRGWRLPSFHELQSLIQPNVVAPEPNLPVGHPFINIQPFYWSATIDAAHPNAAWIVDFIGGSVGGADVLLGNNMPIWCVRGGMHADAVY